MSLIATIPASTKQTINIQNLYEFIVLGEVNSAFSADIEVDVKGTNRIRAKSPQIKTLNAIGCAGVLTAGLVAQNLVHVANGGQGNEQVQLTIDNKAITALKIYGFSTSNNNGTVVKVQESSIVANSSETYTGFEALIFDQTNVADVQITFADGWSDRLTKTELRSLLAKLNPAIQDLNLIAGNNLVIDNRLDYVQSIRIYASSSGSIPVLSKSYELI